MGPKLPCQKRPFCIDEVSWQRINTHWMVFHNKSNNIFDFQGRASKSKAMRPCSTTYRFKSYDQLGVVFNNNSKHNFYFGIELSLRLNQDHVLNTPLDDRKASWSYLFILEGFGCTLESYACYYIKFRPGSQRVRKKILPPNRLILNFFNFW